MQKFRNDDVFNGLFILKDTIVVPCTATNKSGAGLKFFLARSLSTTLLKIYDKCYIPEQRYNEILEQK